MQGCLIIHVTAEFKEFIWGGIATAVDLVSTSMAEDGFDVCVISSGSKDFKKKIKDRMVWQQVSWEEKSLTNLYLSKNRVQLGEQLSKVIVDIVKSYAKDRKCVVFVHNEEFSAAAESLSVYPNVVVLAVSHGLANQEHPNKKELWIQQNRFFNSASVLIVHSSAQKRLLEKNFPEVQPKVIPLPLGKLKKHASVERKKSEIKKGFIIAAGRDTYQKGFDLIEPSLLLTDRNADIDCSIYCCKDSEINKIHKKILPNGHSLTWERWLPRDILLSKIARAHLVLVPSRFEPLGLIAAEAMMLNVPVVVSKVGGLQELVDSQKVGQVVRTDKNGPLPHKIAEAIEYEIERGPRISQGLARIQKFSYGLFFEAFQKAIDN